MNNLKTVCMLVFIPGMLVIMMAQNGCGGSKTPAPSETEAGKESPAKGGAASSAGVKFPSMKLPAEVEAELVKSIKDWVAKKGHAIEKDKNGMVLIKTQKGRKAKPAVTLFPPPDKLPQAVANEMTNRVRQWAEKKGYTFGVDKKGYLVGKTPKGKDAMPPFNLFLQDLPAALADGAATSASSGAGSNASGTSGGADDDGEGNDN